LLGRRRLFPLRDVGPRLGLENIALHVPWLGTEFGDHIFGLGRVGDELAALDVGVLLADQPLLRAPRAALPFAGNALDVPRFADVLGAERRELVFGPHADVEILSTPLRAGLHALAAFGLRPAVLPAGHGFPGGLGFPNIFACRGSLFLRGHLPPPYLKSENPQRTN